MVNHNLFSALAVIVSLGSSSAIAQVVEWKIGDGGNGHWYELVDVQLSWPEAKSAAEASTRQNVSGHLVTITSEQEYQFVLGNVGLDVFEPWMGLTDSEQYGGHESVNESNPQVDGWFWVTAETVSFTAWGPNEPNNYQGTEEDFAHISNQGGILAGWNDVPPDWHRADSYIVEYEGADTTPPELFGSVSPDYIWPPNHKMMEVSIGLEAADDQTPTAELFESLQVRVSSSEPDSGKSRGNRAGDVNGFDGFIAPVDVSDLFALNADSGLFEGAIGLRAERLGGGDGRTYFLEATVWDAAGNAAVFTSDVLVPHDRSQLMAIPEPATSSLLTMAVLVFCGTARMRGSCGRRQN